jgi:hypothetical protein
MCHLRALTPALALCILFASAACEPNKPAEQPAPAAQAEPAKAPDAPAAPAEPAAPAANADPMSGLPQIPEPVLPTFIDPPEGPRTPSAKAFDFMIGETTQAQALEFVAKHNVTCVDSSPRAMFIAIYKKYQEKGVAGMHGHKGMADGANPHAAPADGANPHAANPHAAPADGANPHMKPAQGEDLKKTGGHGHGNYTEMAKNPQVRLSCEKAPASIFSDRARATTDGRLLLIFDSEAHPMRLASFTRQFKDAAAAKADFESSLKAVEAVYGKPTESEGELGKTGFAGFVSVRRTWKFADFEVSVVGTGLGSSGSQVEERFDVPSPVRVDAVVKK